MKLGELQEEFAHAHAQLVIYAYAEGYRIREGDSFRDPRAFGAMGTRKAYGRSNSLHKLKLAADLNLFKGGEYLTTTEAHRPLGTWWEETFKEFKASWGGHFNDGNHYSFAYLGFR